MTIFLFKNYQIMSQNIFFTRNIPTRIYLYRQNDLATVFLAYSDPIKQIFKNFSGRTRTQQWVACPSADRKMLGSILAREFILNSDGLYM